MKTIAIRTMWSGGVAALAVSSFLGVRLLMAQAPPEKVPASEPKANVPVQGRSPDTTGRLPSADSYPTNRFGQPGWGYKPAHWSELPGKGAADVQRDATTRELMAQFAKSDKEDERSKIADEIAKIVGEQFDARQKARDDELKELEAQLAQLRKLHDKRTTQKEMIIRERTRQLLRDADGLGWSGAGDGGDPVLWPAFRPEPQAK